MLKRWEDFLGYRKKYLRKILPTDMYYVEKTNKILVDPILPDRMVKVKPKKLPGETICEN